MIPDGVEKVTLTGVFLDKDGQPIKNFLMKLEGSRPGLVLHGDTDVFLDLGPIYIVLDDLGRIKIRNQTGPVEVIANFKPDQPFHYKVEISGCDLPIVYGIILVEPGSVVDVPNELLEQIDYDDLPDWAAILSQVKSARDQVVEIADGLANGEVMDNAIKEYLVNNPIEGVTQPKLDATMDAHINDLEPHPAYDSIPRLALIFDNHLI